MFYRLDKQDFIPMRKVRERDPYMAAIRAKWDQAEDLPEGIRPSNTSVSEHLWKAGMPRQLKPGKHLIEVKVLHGEPFSIALSLSRLKRLNNSTTTFVRAGITATTAGCRFLVTFAKKT